MTEPERKPFLVTPPDGQDQPGKAVLSRIFDKLETLQLDGAVNKENLRQIKEQVKDLGGRTQGVGEKTGNDPSRTSRRGRRLGRRKIRLRPVA